MNVLSVTICYVLRKVAEEVLDPDDSLIILTVFNHYILLCAPFMHTVIKKYQLFSRLRQIIFQNIKNTKFGFNIYEILKKIV